MTCSRFFLSFLFSFVVAAVAGEPGGVSWFEESELELASLLRYSNNFAFAFNSASRFTFALMSCLSRSAAIAFNYASRWTCLSRSSSWRFNALAALMSFEPKPTIFFRSASL